MKLTLNNMSKCKAAIRATILLSYMLDDILIKTFHSIWTYGGGRAGIGGGG